MHSPDQSAYVFSEWQAAHFRPVNQFYRSQKHKGSASGDERVFTISLKDEIIAAVRLVPHENYYWLRSLYVKAELQGQQLGSKLLTYVHQHIVRPIYCFPYQHLDHFYKKAGYALVLESELPLTLQQLYARYNRKGQGILAMAKNRHA